MMPERTEAIRYGSPNQLAPEEIRQAKIVLGVTWPAFARALGYQGVHAGSALWQMAHGIRPIPARVSEQIRLLLSSDDARQEAGLPRRLKEFRGRYKPRK